MDGHTQLDASLDRVEHDRIVDAIAEATTWEQVEDIRKTCQHKYRTGKGYCMHCGFKRPVDDNVDDIPF